MRMINVSVRTQMFVQTIGASWSRRPYVVQPAAWITRRMKVPRERSLVRRVRHARTACGAYDRTVSTPVIDPMIDANSSRGMFVPVSSTPLVPGVAARTMSRLLRSRATERTGGQTARELARWIIDWSGAPRPTSLRHDAAAAVVIRLCGVLEAGLLTAIPADVRRCAFGPYGSSHFAPRPGRVADLQIEP